MHIVTHPQKSPQCCNRKRKIVRLLDEEIRLNTTHFVKGFYVQTISRTWVTLSVPRWDSQPKEDRKQTVQHRALNQQSSPPLRSPLHSFSAVAGIVSELRLHFRGVDRGRSDWRLCPRGGRVNASSGIVSPRSGRSPLTLRHSTWECSLCLPVFTCMEEWSMYVCWCVSMSCTAIGPLGKFRSLIYK